MRLATSERDCRETKSCDATPANRPSTYTYAVTRISIGFTRKGNEPDHTPVSRDMYYIGYNIILSLVYALVCTNSSVFDLVRSPKSLATQC